MEPRGLNAIPPPYEADRSYHHSPANRRPIFHTPSPSLPTLFKDIKQDDIILIALIVLLLMEGDGCDLLLVGMLVVIFLS